jgi:hypothetical protein
VDAINQKQNELNKLVSDINATVTMLNRISEELNLHVDRYNKIGDEQGGEFEEGVYRSDIEGTNIDIYQYDNKAVLIRLLAHELGHALGLDHVDSPDAIMYRLNQAKNLELTPNDISALKLQCKLEQ